LFASQFSFSQTEKSLKGTITCENFLIQNVAVINKTLKTSTITNEIGEFIIVAKANDSLYFYAKDYYLKKIKLTTENIKHNNLVVSMLKKPEELEEVVITKLPSIKWEIDKKWEQDKRDEIVLNKAENKLKTGVYDGTIEKGADLIRIAGMIVGLFSKEKEPIKEAPPKIEFKVYAKSTCDPEYYIKELRLKPEQIELFLEFCDADPKSKTILQNSNILILMDFLSAKNVEFKKL
jgi:hypothetical protein